VAAHGDADAGAAFRRTAVNTIATSPWWQPQAVQPRRGTEPAGVSRGVAAEAPVLDARARRTALIALEGSQTAYYALIGFTFVLLLSPQAWFPVLKLIRIALLGGGIAIAAHVLERTAHKQPITPLAPEIGIALALVIWSTITIPMSYWPGGSVHLLTDQYLKAIIFFWMLATMITTPARLRGMAWTLALCAIPLAGTGIWHYLSGDVMRTSQDGLVRVVGYQGSSGLTGNPNDLALMLNLIIPLCGALALSSTGFRRMAAMGIAFLSILGVIITFSRAGFLALAATFFMFLVVLVRRKSGAAAMGLLIVALAVPAMLPKTYVERLSTITNMNEDKTGSAQGRYKDLFLALDVVAHNPVIGVGMGQDMIALNQERGQSTWRSVHNVYLEYAVDLGIPGFLLFSWLHLLCFRSAWAVEKRTKRDPALRDVATLAAGVQVSLVSFLVAAMFHPIAYQFYFFTIAGLAVALKNTYRHEHARQRLFSIDSLGTPSGVAVAAQHL
jgi:probable O-glycosylation ligase (exosortase A-associated)